MVFTLLPAVTLHAHDTAWAPFIQVVLLNGVLLSFILITVPVWTLCMLIWALVWFAPKVLPIVRVDASIALMVIFVHWAPSCLEVEHVEICVLLVFIN